MRRLFLVALLLIPTLALAETWTGSAPFVIDNLQNSSGDTPLTTGAGELSGMTEKASPVSADLLVIEDSAAGGVKKKVQVGNLPAGATNYTDLDFTGTTGLSDGVDNTGLPSQIILYSDYANFAAFDTACTSGVLAYIDANDTLTSQTATLECVVEFLPGSVWTDGGGNSITINNLRAPQDQQIFEGFSSGLTIGLSTPNLFFKWWGPELSPPFDDQPEFAAMTSAAQSGHRLWCPVESTFTVNSTTTINSALKLYGRGSKAVSDSDSNFLYVVPDTLDSGTGESITITAGSNSFTIPAAMSVSVGDLVHIWSTTAWWTTGQNYYHGVLANVVEVSGSTAYLDAVPPYSFTGDSFTVYDRLDGAIVDGFIVDVSAQSGAIDQGAINFSNVSNSKIQNNTFYGADDSAYAVLARGNNVEITGNIASNFWNVAGNVAGTGRTGYAFAASSGKIVIRNNRAIDAKHCVTASGANLDPAGILVDNNVCYQSDDGTSVISGGGGDGQRYAQPPFDAHTNVHDITYTNNRVSTSAFSGLNHRGAKATLINNTIEQRASAPDLNTTFIYETADSQTGDLTLLGNTFSSSVAGMELMDAALEAVSAVDAANRFSGISRNQPTCAAGTVGKVWYTPGASSEHEVCMQTGASTYAWTSTVLPDSLNQGLLVGNGVDWIARQADANNDIAFSYSTGFTMNLKNGVIEAVNMEATNSPADNQVPSYDLATGGFTWVANGGGSDQLDSLTDVTAFGTTGYVLTDDGDGTYSFQAAPGAAGGDSISVDGSAASDPNFLSTGDIDFVLGGTANEITANINTDAVDDLHIDWGTGPNQVSVADIPGALDTAGSPASTYIPFFSDADTLDANSGFKYDDSTATNPILTHYGSTRVDMVMETDGATNYNAPYLIFKRSRSGGAIQSGDRMGLIAVQGKYDGSNYISQRAILHAYATENWSSTNQGFEWIFTSTANGSTANSLRMTIPEYGGIQIAGTAEPTCNADNRFSIIPVSGGAGVADTFRICMKNSSDSYVWTTIASP